VGVRAPACSIQRAQQRTPAVHMHPTRVSLSVRPRRLASPLHGMGKKGLERWDSTSTCTPPTLVQHVTTGTHSQPNAHRLHVFCYPRGGNDGGGGCGPGVCLRRGGVCSNSLLYYMHVYCYPRGGTTAAADVGPGSVCAAVEFAAEASAGVHMPLIQFDTDEYPSPMAVPTIRTCNAKLYLHQIY
jgi:hypothetical protein